ncbi:NUDIX hydrolase [Varunaivibrio sulfuroxidans]|uniref:NUDIX hydrolase n=1 Tax=Varunaivibrio sulfuroxidans TaxID=1773489 RepID=UPI00104BC7D9|nr:NUDIX hydrolase [Varunaivibrio sulfuroxidans]WES30227.1 NUDIX hydrolase [Varunaivibrio sulfuroxidans]
MNTDRPEHDAETAPDSPPSPRAREGGGPLVETIPEGDNRARLVCPDCGYIEYANPKVVVGAVCVWEEKILLCRRAIAPRIGYWTIPAGYMELNESTTDGAVREVREEACTRILVDGLVGIYEIPHISQVHVIHRARLSEPVFAPGIESQEVALFAWADIPWDALAFPSNTWALERFREGGGPVLYTAKDVVTLD